MPTLIAAPSQVFNASKMVTCARAALTVYDMTMALDKRIEIQDIYLLEKTGGKSGDFHREDEHL